MALHPPVVGYARNTHRYLHITNQRTRRRTFCPRFHGSRAACGRDLQPPTEPGADEIAIRDPAECDEISFNGRGEPVRQRYDMMAAAPELCGGRRHPGGSGRA